MKGCKIFIDENGNRRIKATKRLELYIDNTLIKTIPKGTIGGVIDKDVKIKKSTILWVDEDSSIEGKIKINKAVVLIGSSYLCNSEKDYVKYNCNLYVKNSDITNLYIDGENGLYIESSVIYCLKIKKSNDYSLLEIKNSHITNSELSEFFDIDDCRIDNSTVSNIHLRKSNDVLLNDLYGIIKNSSIASKNISFIRLTAGTKINQSKIDICFGNIYFPRYDINNAEITKLSNFVTIFNIGSRDDVTLFYKRKIDGIYKIWVCCGCFDNDIGSFEEKVKITYPDENSEYRKQYMHAIAIARATINLD